MHADEARAKLEKFHGASFGWALHCCQRDWSLAEEVLQTVYLKVLDGRARFEGRSSFKTWLHALIRNTAADERRRRSRQEAGLVAYRQLAPGATSDARPDETLDRSQVQTLLRRALTELPERQQEVVQLVFYHDLSLSEAAEVMGVSVGSARTHYERGKQRLRQLLEKEKVFGGPRIG